MNSDLLDPSSSALGVFGGFVLALQLDVDFSDSGHISGASGLRFGDLRLCGLTTTPAYNGMTVREFLGVSNTALGAGAAAYSFGDMAILTGEVSGAFEGGTPSSFAQTHLVNGACPTVWHNGDLVTYSQDNWGDPVPSAAAALLFNRFNFIYPAGLEIGIPGTSGFSIVFTSAAAIVDFLPGSGTAGPLNNDLMDPAWSASGAFGGYVLALQLSVDFTGSGDLVGASGLKFGDLRLCGLQNTPAYNNLTVRQYLIEMNKALGAGPTAYNYDELTYLTYDLSLAFEAGIPSNFAQAHLGNGACP